MLIVLAISVFCFDSVEAIALGFVISAWIDAFVTTLPLKKLMETNLRQQFLPLINPMCAALIMSAAVYALGLLNLPLIIKLMLQILAGAVVYALACLIMKVDGMEYLLGIIRRKKGTKEA